MRTYSPASFVWTSFNSAVCAALTLSLTFGTVAQPAAAQPLRPLAGTFTVNSGLDTTTSDGVLTLREAVLIANGGTGAGGLARALSASEAAQLAGCTISSGLITGGCGAGVPDTIVYAAAITRTVLAATLPYFSDNATTLAPSARVELDFNGATGPLSAGIWITANDVTIANLTIVNLGTSEVGIMSQGLRTTLRDNYIGTRPNIAGCQSDNIFVRMLHGIQIMSKVPSAADANYVYGNTIGCAGNSGIVLISTDYSRIGLDQAQNPHGNRIGVSGNSELPVPNSATGILLMTSTVATVTTGTRSSDIAYNVIAGNGGNGILLLGSGVNDINSVTLNTIRANYLGYRPITKQPLGNAGSGVAAANGAFLNLIGGTSAADANVIVANNGSGVNIQDSNFNGVLGNDIGVFDPLTTTLGNKGFGVSVANGNNNLVGGYSFFVTSVNGNRIGSNQLSGVSIQGGSGNQVIGNEIGSHNGLIRPNKENGIRLFKTNLARIGSDANSSWGNSINNNTVVGVWMEGVTTTLVAGNVISNNVSSGVYLAYTTTNNVIGAPGFPNTITMNGNSGIVLGYATNNTIHYNLVDNNLYNGISLNVGAISNTITSTVISRNGLDGINLTPGLLYNNWSQLRVFDNGGLGIDVDATGVYLDTPNPGPLTIDSASYSGLQMNVGGHGTPSTGGVTSAVELYFVGSPRDPSGYGEGWIYLGSTATNASGLWSMTIDGHWSCVTAFETVTTPVAGGPKRQSGEFAFNRCVGAYLPIVQR